MSAPKSPAKDVVLPLAPTDDGKGVHVLRAREDRVEAGEIRPVAEGQSVRGELVRLTPRADAPALCDVEVLHDPRAHAREAEGTAGVPRLTRPAQVATDTYRAHWTRIFGAKLEDDATLADPSKLN